METIFQNQTRITSKDFWCKMTDNGKLLKSFDVNFWIGRWEEKNTRWHREVVNPLLTKFIDLLDGGKTNLKILVPLCGKTVDMKWLFDQGHRVVGAEASRLAIEDFFKEQSLQYTTETKNGITVFVEKSGGIIIYCCDFYDFLKIGESSFDAIWDRGSLASINPEDRVRYLSLVTSLKTASCPHLIELYEYDDSLYQEFPYSIPMSKVLELFGDRYDVKFIDSHEATDVMTNLGIKFTRNLFLATLN